MAILAAVGSLLTLVGAHGSRSSVPGADGVLAVSSGGNIYLVSAENGARTTATLGQGAAWAPDGRRLVVWRRTPGPCAPCFFEILLVTPQSGEERRIVEGSGFDPAPAWSPDGRRIAYSAISGGVNHIFSVNVDGTDVRQLSRESDAFNPTWSPDAARIAYNAFTGSGVHVITINADGSSRRELTVDAQTFNVRPDWSPDGSQIAFGSDREGTWELWTMAADGAGKRRLTSEGQATTCRTTGCFLHRLNPSWSPTGNAIAFLSERAGEGIAVVDPDGANRRTIPGTGGSTLARWQSGVSLTLTPSRRTLKTGPVGTARRTTLVLRNEGPVSATNVRIRLVPTRARVRATTVGGTCTGSLNVTCSYSSLAAGAAHSIALSVTPRTAGSIIVAATVSAARADVGPTNDVARISMTARRR